MKTTVSRMTPHVPASTSRWGASATSRGSRPSARRRSSARSRSSPAPGSLAVLGLEHDADGSARRRVRRHRVLPHGRRGQPAHLHLGPARAGQEASHMAEARRSSSSWSPTGPPIPSSRRSRSSWPRRRSRPTSRSSSGFQADGVELVRKGVAETVTAPEFAPLAKLMADVRELGGLLLVCGPCVKSRGITRRRHGRWRRGRRRRPLHRRDHLGHQQPRLLARRPEGDRNMTATTAELETMTTAKVVDARGSACPGPLLEAKKSMGTVPVGLRHRDLVHRPGHQDATSARGPARSATSSSVSSRARATTASSSAARSSRSPDRPDGAPPAPPARSARHGATRP